MKPQNSVTMVIFTYKKDETDVEGRATHMTGGNEAFFLRDDPRSLYCMDRRQTRDIPVDAYRIVNAVRYYGEKERTFMEIVQALQRQFPDLFAYAIEAGQKGFRLLPPPPPAEEVTYTFDLKITVQAPAGMPEVAAQELVQDYIRRAEAAQGYNQGVRMQFSEAAGSSARAMQAILHNAQRDRDNYLNRRN